MTTPVPLTTIFNPAPQCFTDYYMYTTQTTYTYYVLGPPSTSLCQPSGWDSTLQYFSPGICPSGYSIACSSTISAGTVTETRATCCPTSWACQVGGDSGLLPWLSTISCTITADNAVTTRTRPITFINSGSTTIFPGTIDYGLNALGVSIRYQSTDFASTTSSKATATPTLSNSAGQTSSGQSRTPMSNGSGPNAPHSTSLSTGAKAGIGAGVGVAALLVLGIAIFFIARHRKRNGAGPGGAKGREHFEIYKPVEIGSGVRPPRYELMGLPLSEVQGTPVEQYAVRRD